MPIRPANGVEPITGYQLVERLGIGGYGEVWKAIAPGGVPKAIKIIYGDMGGPRAEQELKALERIKQVRHPFLLSLERFEIVDGQLLIVTELADQSLLERFQACRAKGLPGIPRDELLGYMRDAADALDYMLDAHGLLHLDIKPQNMLLMGGRIKVGDFGLVKELLGTSATATGGVTPIYATPEAFDGRISRYSDQYSLAIVYQEMLTGMRPYPGTTAYQLAAQHTSGRPMLDPLPPQDRKAVARALAKVPEQRFPSCREMVAELLKVPAPAPAPPGEAVPRPPGRDSDPGVLNQRTVVGDVSLSGPPLLPGDTGVPRRAAETGLPGPLLAPLTLDKAGLRPTLFLGVGGLACATLRRLRRRLAESFDGLDNVPVFGFLFLDTDRAELRKAHRGRGAEALPPEETLLTPLHPPEHYRDQAKGFLRWLDRRWLYGIPRSQLTEGLRPLGRLALVANAEAVLARLRQTLAAVTSAEAVAVTAASTGRNLRAESPRVFVIGSATGGTAGGMLCGLGYAARQVLGELGLPADGLCTALLHATNPKPTDRVIARANAYATLAELSHWNRADTAYPGDPEHGLAGASASKPPFEECYFVNLGDELSQPAAESAASALAEYFCFDATSGGSFLDQYRLGTRQAAEGAAGRQALRSFGLYRLSFPRRLLVEGATNRLCRRLVEGWPGEATTADRTRLDQEARRLAAEVGLAEDAILGHLHDTTEAALGEDPDAAFGRLFASVPPPAAPAGGPPAREEFARLIHAQLDEFLGPGPEPGDEPGAPDSSEGSRLGIQTSRRRAPAEAGFFQQARAHAAELGARLVEWLLDLVEDPVQRLKAAECAAAALQQYLHEITQQVRGKLNQLQSYRHGFRRQQVAGTGSGERKVLRWLRLGRQRPDADRPGKQFHAFFWLRLEEIALENTLNVLGSVYAEVANFSQDLTLCSRKLAQFAETFPDDVPAGEPGGTPNLSELLPGRADGLSAAVDTLVGQLPLELTRQLDEDFQAEVLNEQGGLWGMVSGNLDPVRRAARQSPASLAFWDMVSRYNDVAEGLKAELRRRAGALVASTLADTDAASLFLDTQGDLGPARKALLAHVQEAMPRGVSSEGWQHLALALPASPAGTALGELAREALPDLSLTVLEAREDVLFCCEAANLSLRRLAGSLVADDRKCVELARRVMSRTDVAWSFFPTEDAVNAAR